MKRKLKKLNKNLLTPIALLTAAVGMSQAHAQQIIDVTGGIITPGNASGSGYGQGASTWANINMTVPTTSIFPSMGAIVGDNTSPSFGGPYTYSSTYGTIVGGTSSLGAQMGFTKSRSQQVGYIDFGPQWASITITQIFASYTTNSHFAAGEAQLFSGGDAQAGTAYWSNSATGATNLGTDSTIFLGLNNTVSTDNAWNLTSNPNATLGGEFLVYNLGNFISQDGGGLATQLMGINGFAFVGTVASTPEPSSTALLLLGGVLGGSVLVARRRQAARLV